MNQYREARKNLKFLVEMVRGLAKLDDDIERAGSLEKLIQEKEQAIERLTGEAANLHAKVAACDEECAERLNIAAREIDAGYGKSSQLYAQAEQALVEANAKVEELVKTGEATAAEARAAGATDANATRAEANAEAAGIKADAEAYALSVRDSALSAAAAEVAQANAKVVELVDGARSLAASLAQEAETKSKDLVDAATAEAARIKTDAEQAEAERHAVAVKALDALNSEIKDGTQRLDWLNTKIDDAKAAELVASTSSELAQAKLAALGEQIAAADQRKTAILGEIDALKRRLQ